MEHLLASVRSIGFPPPGAMSAQTGEIVTGDFGQWLPLALIVGDHFYPYIRPIEPGSMGVVFYEIPFTCPEVALFNARRMAASAGR